MCRCFFYFFTIFVFVEFSSSRLAKIKFQGHLFKCLICVRNISVSILRGFFLACVGVKNVKKESK